MVVTPSRNPTSTIMPRTNAQSAGAWMVFAKDGARQLPKDQNNVHSERQHDGSALTKDYTFIDVPVPPTAFRMGPCAKGKKYFAIWTPNRDQAHRATKPRPATAKERFRENGSSSALRHLATEEVCQKSARATPDNLFIFMAIVIVRN